MSHTKISKQARMDIIHSQECKCIYCHTEIDLDTYCIDHIIPYAMCRSNKLDNLVAACWRCNTFKSDRLFQNVYHAARWIRRKLDLPLLPPVQTNGLTNAQLVVLCMSTAEEIVSLFPELLLRDNA